MSCTDYFASVATISARSRVIASSTTDETPVSEIIKRLHLVLDYVEDTSEA